MHHSRYESRAAVRRRLVPSVAVLSAAAVLYACATPSYPTATRVASGVASTPAPVAAIPAPPVSPPPEQGTTSATPPVGSEALPPVSGADMAPREAPTSDYASHHDYTPPQAREVTRTIAGGHVESATRMFRDYVVRKGDHLDAVARDFKVDASEMIGANHLKSPDSIRPGQHLKIPVAKAYVVQSGDTLSAVAKRFDLVPDTLAELNDLSVKSHLRAGDRLALPAEYNDRGPTKVTQTVYARQERYRPPERDETPPPVSGQYTPSAAALKAAADRSDGGQMASAGSRARTYADRVSRYAPVIGRPVGEAAPSLTDAQISAAGRGLFIWPVKGETLARFGAQGIGRRNDGLDVRTAQGSTVHAAAAGEVVYAGNQVPGFGNLVLVKHADGWVTAYAHLDHASVQMRQTVTQGQEIGQVGVSGGVAEPQLHFEVRYAAAPTDKAKPIDPLLVLPVTPG